MQVLCPYESLVSIVSKSDQVSTLVCEIAVLETTTRLLLPVVEEEDGCDGGGGGGGGGGHSGYITCLPQ